MKTAEIAFYFLAFPAGAVACFFFWFAVLALAFCVDFFCTDFGDLSPMILFSFAFGLLTCGIVVSPKATDKVGWQVVDVNN
ncbi:hypothetical protein [Pedosphaera parvula]|uniref:hypothetical protein n=1 Tax=Pedosphaera parvula TaxID=1032527 RepID=UPI00058C9152|nr:hypothetical protein [Pedosphaera parvula]